jgi:O-antigen ligase
MVMSLFLPPQLQVLVAIGTCIYFVVRTYMIRERPPAANFRWAFLLGGGYLLYIMALPLTPPRYSQEVHALCERRMAYLLLPIVFAIVAPRFRQVIISQLRYFVYGCIIACTLANIDYLYHHFIVGGVSGELSHVAYRNIFEFFTGIHPTYMSMYLAFALCITLVQFEPINKRQVISKYVLIYVLLVFMLALFAKSPIIALCIIAVHYLVKNRHIMYKLKWPFAALVAIVAGAYAFIPFFRQRAEEMLGLFRTDTNANITQNSVNVRKLIFNTDMGLLKHYWLAGTGPGRMLERLNQRYFFHSIYRGYWVGYFDPHNQYFYDWLCFGIVGIALLIVVLFVQFRSAIVSRNNLYLYLLIILMVTFFTESLLARQQGLLFYSIFTSLLFFAAFSGKADSADKLK